MIATNFSGSIESKNWGKPECENLLYLLDMSSKVYRMNYCGNSDNELLNWYEKFIWKNHMKKSYEIWYKNWYEICFENFDMKIDPDK